MQVHTGIGGSHLVVQLRPNHFEYYIDSRKDVRYPGWSFIEVVRQGQVRLHDSVRDSEAPERIIKLMRERQ